MLGRKYRFTIKNETGQTMTYNSGSRLTLAIRKWKMTSTGALEFSSEVVINLLNSGETLANAAYVSCTVIDNSTDLYLGVIGTLTVTTDHASTAGPVVLYYEPSAPDAGDVFATNGDGIRLADAMMTMAAAQTRRANFEV